MSRRQPPTERRWAERKKAPDTRMDHLADVVQSSVLGTDAIYLLTTTAVILDDHSTLFCIGC